MTITTLTTKDGLLAATAGAPVVRYEVADDCGPALHRDGATVFGRLTQRGEPDLVGLGPADALASLLADVLPTLPEPLARAGGITVEESSAQVLGAVGAAVPASWQIMVCTRGSGLGLPAPSGVRLLELPRARYDEALAFLDEHYTSAWTTPGRMEGERWLGYERDGELLAVGCASLTPAGYVRLGGITVDGSARGLGLGTALTARLTRVGLEHGGAVTLGLDAGNPAAEHVYRRLGYRTAHRWLSAPLVGGCAAGARC